MLSSKRSVIIEVMNRAPYIDELRLTRFKSLQDAVLPLRDLTLLIGRNGSGKSNAIDGLHVLARLAEGEDIVGAIDGSRRDGSEVRGGVRGCAPYGATSFEIGCTVVHGTERIRLDLEIQVEPDVQILKEELWVIAADGTEKAYLITDAPQPGLVDIVGAHFNGKKGRNPKLPFRSDRLLTAQIPTKIPGTTAALRLVHAAAIAVTDALRAVFILDPVPSLMRQYSPRRDVNLRRQADNISAVIAGLQTDADRWQRLGELVRELPEQDVVEIGVESSALGDVMLALHERFAGRDVPFSARVMSDGMLRYLAFAAALLEAPEISIDDAERANTQLVIEEVENGLHPSQAAMIVRLIKEEAARRTIRTLTTTHSPAMLSALDAEDHGGVIVCRRDPDTAVTQLVRLIDLPRYPEAMAAGTLGEAVTERRLDGAVDIDRRLAALESLLSEI